MSSFWNLFIYVRSVFSEADFKYLKLWQGKLKKGCFFFFFFVVLLEESISFGWTSWQGFCRTKDDICVCVVLYECAHVQVRVCADVRAQVWECGGLKLTSLYCCSPVSLEAVSTSLTESRTQHSSRLPGQSASPGEPSASTASVLGLQACTMETVFPRDQIQVNILRGECLAMDPPSQPQYQFIT